MKARVETLVIVALVLLVTLAPPRAAESQQKRAIPRIGYLSNASRAATTATTDAFRRGLREHGYVDGQNVVIEWRYAENRPERYAGLIAELVRLPVDVIVTIGAPAAQSAQQATKTIPVVFWAVNDPIGAGLVTSLARPGGNITGLTNVNVELMQKRLALLSETVPRTKKIAVLDSPGPATMALMKELDAPARCSSFPTACSTAIVLA